MNCIGDLLKCDKNYIFTQFVDGDWFIRSNKFILQWNWQKKLSVLSRFGLCGWLNQKNHEKKYNRNTMERNKMLNEKKISMALE